MSRNQEYQDFWYAGVQFFRPPYDTIPLSLPILQLNFWCMLGFCASRSRPASNPATIKDSEVWQNQNNSRQLVLILPVCRLLLDSLLDSKQKAMLSAKTFLQKTNHCS